MNQFSFAVTSIQLLYIVLVILTLNVVLAVLDLAAVTWASPVDKRIDLGIIRHRTKLETAVMHTLSVIGGPYGILIGSLLLTFLFSVTIGMRTGLLLFFIVGISIVYALIFKRLTARRRPTHKVLERERTFSFPSAHTLASTTLYGGAGIAVFHEVGGFIGAIVLTLIAFLVLAIGLSRIYLGSHYFSDVIGGLVGGMVWVGIFLFLLK